MHNPEWNVVFEPPKPITPEHILQLLPAEFTDLMSDFCSKVTHAPQQIQQLYNTLAYLYPDTVDTHTLMVKPAVEQVPTRLNMALRESTVLAYTLIMYEYYTEQKHQDVAINFTTMLRNVPTPALSDQEQTSNTISMILVIYAVLRSCKVTESQELISHLQATTSLPTSLQYFKQTLLRLTKSTGGV